MAQHLMEEDRRGASAQDRRAIVGFGDGRDAQVVKVLGHRLGLRQHLGLRGKVAGGIGLKGLGAEEVHTVGGAGARQHDQPRDLIGRRDVRTLAGDKVVRLMRGLQDGHVVVDIRIAAEDRADLAQARLPRGAVERQRRGGGEHFALRLLGGEVRGGVLLLGTNLLLCLYLFQRIQRLAISAIGGEPESPFNRRAVIGERQWQRGERTGAVDAVGVVLRRRAEAHLHVRSADVAAVGGGEGEAAGEGGEPDFGGEAGGGQAGGG